MREWEGTHDDRERGGKGGSYREERTQSSIYRFLRKKEFQRERRAVGFRRTERGKKKTPCFRLKRARIGGIIQPRKPGHVPDEEKKKKGKKKGELVGMKKGY